MCGRGRKTILKGNNWLKDKKQPSYLWWGWGGGALALIQGFMVIIIIIIIMVFIYRIFYMIYSNAVYMSKGEIGHQHI